jgi:trehalose 6-phosphate phosphatase
MAEPGPPLSLLEDAALFLDFDGTLVELAETPDAISVPPALAPLLDRLNRRLGGRLALVTGRSIAGLERHLRCTGLALSGSHGIELRLANGRSLTAGQRHDLEPARERLKRLAAETPGLLVEDKPFGVALHYRQAPEQAGAVAAVMEELGQASGLSLQKGKMVIELRPPGADKGDAVRAFMAEPEFAGARPLFLGDDMTDEHAFAAAAELGGAGILVGPPRATAAKWRLENIGAVIDWLSRGAGPANG